MVKLCKVMKSVDSNILSLVLLLWHVLQIACEAWFYSWINLIHVILRQKNHINAFGHVQC
uniref:Uncharacterized protein n=1 Tax=Rhizophora mucronata TaxID=61149 RepID=A0A2P2QQB7_RHIMU